MTTHVRSLVQTHFLRKLAAWTALIALMSTMLLSMPISVHAAPVKDGNAQYMPNNGQGNSVIVASFSEVLDAADGSVECPEGLSECFNTENIVLGGSGWNGTPTVTAAFRDANDNRNMNIQFSTENVITDIGQSPTITVNSGIAGVTVNQTFDIVMPPPPTPTATYLQMDFASANLSTIMVNKDTNVTTDSAEDCSGYSEVSGIPGDPSICFNPSGVTLVNEGGWDSPTVTAVYVPNGNPKNVVVLFNKANAADLTANPKPQITLNGFGGFTNVTYDLKPPNPTIAYTATASDFNNFSVLTATMGNSFTTTGQYDCSNISGVTKPHSPTLCYDPSTEGRITKLGGGWDDTATVIALYVDPENDKKLYVVYSKGNATNPANDPAPQIQLGDFGGLMSPGILFDVVGAVEPPPAPSGPTVSCTDSNGACTFNDGDAETELPKYVDSDPATGSHVQGPNYPINFVLDLGEVTGIHEVRIVHKDENQDNYVRNGAVDVWNGALNEGAGGWQGWVPHATFTDDGADNVVSLVGPAESFDVKTTKIRITSTENNNTAAGWWPTEFVVRSAAPTSILGSGTYLEGESNSTITVDFDEPLRSKVTLQSCPGIAPENSVCYDVGRATATLSGSSVNGTPTITRMMRTDQLQGGAANQLEITFNSKALNDFADATLELAGFANIQGTISLTAFEAAAPKKSGSATYVAQDPVVSKSVLTLGFSPKLTSEGLNISHCDGIPQGVLADGDSCADPTKAVLGGTGWNGTPTVEYFIVKSTGESAKVILDTANAITNLGAEPAPTVIAKAGVAGIADDQEFSIVLAPVDPKVDSVQYYNDYDGQGYSTAILRFTDNLNASDNALESCPQGAPQGVTCFPTAGVQKQAEGWDAGVIIESVYLDSNSPKQLTVVFSNSGSITSYSGPPALLVNGIAGVTGKTFEITEEYIPPATPEVTDLWVENQTSVHVVFNREVTQQEINEITFQLEGPGFTLDSDSATVDSTYASEVLIVFTTAMSNASLSDIVIGTDGYQLTINGESKFMNSDFDDAGGWFGPPVVVNEINTRPLQDWSSVSFNSATNPTPGGSGSIIAGLDNDQYIELRVNDAEGGMYDSITTEGALDLTKLRLEVYDNDWKLLVACNLAAGPSCATVDGEYKFNDVLYSGTFGTPKDGDYLLLKNPQVNVLPAGDLRVEMKSQVDDMFISDVQFGDFMGDGDWNASTPAGLGRTTASEAVGLDSKGSFMGYWNGDYAAQTATPLKDNSFVSPFEVMSVFACSGNEICVDFNKAVDSSTLLNSNFSIVETGTETPGVCEGNTTCNVISAFRESDGGGRYISLTLNTNLIANKDYDLKITGGDNGVTDTDGTKMNEAVAIRGFRGYETDNTAPIIQYANVNYEREVEVYFDEWSGLQNPTSVTVSPSLSVDSYWTEWDRLVVTFTEDIQSGTTYTATINGLQDWENNEMTDNKTVQFEMPDWSSYDDNQSPYVTSWAPGSWDWSVPTNTSSIQIGFSEEMDKDTIIDANFELYTFDENNWVRIEEVDLGEQSSSYDNDSRTAIITIPDDTLVANTLYEFKVASAVADKSGTTMDWEEVTYFQTSAGVDTTKPSITYITLDDYRDEVGSIVGVPTSLDVITMYFDEDMKSSTINDSSASDSGSNIMISSSLAGTTQYMTGTVEYDSGSNTASFYADNTFNADTEYTLTIGTGVKDSAGNALSSQVTRTFTTGDTDTTKPQVMSADFDGYRVRIQFDEGMDKASAEQSSNYTLAFDGENYSASGLVVDYFRWDNAVEISGFSGVSEEASFEVTVSSNVTDTAGNPIDSNYNSYSGDGYNPDAWNESAWIMEAGPYWGEWGIANNLKVAVATFNMGLSANVNTDTVKLTSADDENTNLCTSVKYLAGSQMVACVLSGDPLDSGRYMFRIGLESYENNYSDTILDENGNKLPWAHYIDFEVGDNGDSKAPKASEISTWPLQDGDTGVAVGLSSISVQFMESMDPTTITSSTFKITEASDPAAVITGTREYYPGGYNVDFYPDTPLTANTEYTLTLTTGIKDTQGNALDQQYTVSFTTGAADKTEPILTYANVSNSEVMVQFNEPVKEDMAISPKNYKFYRSEGGGDPIIPVSLEGVNIEYFPGENTAFIWGLNLPSNEKFSITAKNIDDIVGNTINSTKNTYTGTISDLTYQDDAPEVWWGGPNGWDEPVNTYSIDVEFSENMNLSTIDASTFKVFPHNCSGYTCNDGVALIADSYEYDQDTHTASLILRDTGGGKTLQPDTEYHVVVTTGITDSNGNALRSWDMWAKGDVAYEWFFHTNSNSAGDTSNPEIWGTSLDHYWVAGTNKIEDVPIYLWGIDIPFSKNMNANTINDLNSSDAGSGIYVQNASTDKKVTGWVDYDSGSRTAVWQASETLSPGTNYELVIESTVQDKMGNGVDIFVQPFKTENVGADEDGPQLVWAEADTYGVTMYFNEPLKKTSAQNIANYTIATCDPTSGIDECLSKLVSVSLTNKQAVYNSTEQSVNIDGLTLTPDNILRITVGSKVVDLAGNNPDTSIDNDPYSPRKLGSSNLGANKYEIFVQPFYDMYYEKDNWTADVAKFNSFTSAQASPENRMAGATSSFFADVPTNKIIPSGGRIELKFPTGFDVSNAALMAGSPLNKNINGAGVGIASISSNSAANTVTITTKDGATFANDYISYDLQGIRNPSTPNESGLVATFKTYDASGKLLEGPIDAAPIYIEPKGSGTINVTVNVEGLDEGESLDNGETVNVHLDSMFGGHVVETSSGYDGSNIVVTFNNVREGDYMVSLDSWVMLDVSGKTTDFKGELGIPIYVGTGGTENITLNLTSLDANSYNGQETKTLTIQATDGPANEKADIFIWGPESYMLEAEFNALGRFTEEVKVVEGYYSVSVEPWMPKTYFTGPAPTQKFMPPEPQDVYVNGGDNTVEFNLKTGENYVNVQIQDEDGDPVPNANVYLSAASGSYSGFGGGISGSTSQDGTFLAAVPEGWYIVDVHKAGFPLIPGTDVVVESSHTKNSPAQVTVVVNVPDIKISGSVTSNSNPVAYVPVSATELDSKGNLTNHGTEGFTDANGKYELFVDENTSWIISAWIPGYGEAQKTVKVEAANKTGQNLQNNTSNFLSVTGAVKYGSQETALTNATVYIKNDTYFNEGKTDETGTFTVRVPTGSDTYTIGVFHSTIGEKTWGTRTISENTDLGTLYAATADLSNVTVKFVDENGSPYTAGAAFIDIYNETTGAGNFMEMKQLSQKKMTVETGEGYTVHAYVEELGPLAEQTDVTITDGGIITFTVDVGVTVQGTVYNGKNALADAKVIFTDPANEFSAQAVTDSEGAYSITVPAGHSYKVSSRKKGYLPMVEDLKVGSDDLTGQNISIEQEASAITISGSVTLDGAAASSNARVVATHSSGKTRTQFVDKNGDYSFKVSAEDNGTWTIKAYSDGYETSEDEVKSVTVSDKNVSGQDIDLSPIAGYTAVADKTFPIVPANGGVIAYHDIGVEVVIPAGALGTSRQNYLVTVGNTSEMIETASANPMTQSGIDLNIKDNNGAAVTSLSSRIKIKQDYSSQGLTAAQKAKMSGGSVGSAADSTWASTGMRNDTTNEVVTFNTNHLTIFGTVDWSDSTAPSAPMGLSAIGYDGSVVLNWVDNSEGDLLEYEVYRSTSSGFTPGDSNQVNTSSVTSSAYTDSTVTNGTTYYYVVTAVDTSGNESSSSSERYATPEGDAGESPTPDPETTTESTTLVGGEPEGSEMLDEDVEEAEEATEETEEVVSDYDFSGYDFIGHWGEEYIEELIIHGIAQGKSENTFAPDSEITRAELTKMVLLAGDYDVDDDVNETSFTDVEATAWYAPYIETAYEEGLVEGYDDGTFHPNDSVNRAEAMKLLIESALGKTIVLDDSKAAYENFGLEENPFPDVDATAWYAKYIYYAYDKGFISGYTDGTFGPGNGMTRAEFSKVLTLGMGW